jgi:large subunit ribosomal protein L29
MKISEIREMTNEQLVSKVKDLKEELFVLKFQQATGKVEGATKAKNIKKDIARCLTVLEERK